MKKFIIVPAVDNSHHVIDIQLISHISRKEGVLNKSEINLIDTKTSLYSTLTPLELFKMLKDIEDSNETV